MSVRFVTSDNKYLQYRYMETDATTTATFTNVANWQGVDDEPTVGSDNLVKSGGVTKYVVVECAVLTPTFSGDRFYMQDLSYQSFSKWIGQIYDIATSEQNQGIIVDCAPRSNAYTSLVDTNNNILWQSNNAADFPKSFSFSDYPTAAKLYVSSEKSVNPNPYCKPIKNIKDIVEELSEQVLEIQQRTISNAETIADQGEAISSIKEELAIKSDLEPVSIRPGFYMQDLSFSGDSSRWKSPLYNITEEHRSTNEGVYIDAAPRSNAYVSITDANDNILWQSNLASDFPRIILFEDYPSIGKIYLSNEFIVKETYKAVFYIKVINAVEKLDSKTSILNNEVRKLSEELSKAFFSNKIHSNNYDSAKKVTLPSEFQSYTIPIDISRDGNVFGWSTDVKKMQKNNEYTATYYCSPNGNDENSGLTISAPLKTLDVALAKSDLNTLILLPGTFVCGEHFTSNLSVDKEINLIGIGSVEMKCKSASEYPIHIKNGCYVENIVFNGGHGALNVSLSELTKVCVFYRCKFFNSHSTNGLNALGGSYYLEECEASNNNRDGFNYHRNTVDNNNILTRVIEINCCGYFNGLNHDSYINNCSTTHESGRIIRIYCEYGSSKGSVIADALRTKSLNIGVTAYSTVNIDGELDSQKANFAAQQGSNNSDPQVFYIIQCSSFGSLFDIYADNNATIYRDTPFPREGTNGTATIENYDLL